MNMMNIIYAKNVLKMEKKMNNNKMKNKTNYILGEERHVEERRVTARLVRLGSARFGLVMQEEFPLSIKRGFII